MCPLPETNCQILQSDFQTAGPVRKDELVEQDHMEEYVADDDAVKAQEQDIFSQITLESCEVTNQIIKTDTNESEASTICPSIVSNVIYSRNNFR